MQARVKKTCFQFTKRSLSYEKLGEERPGLRCKSTKNMEYNKQFFEKVFSTKRMERYFNLYPGDEARAVLHYRCNLELAEAFYTSLSVFEVTLRNALCRELETMTGRPDWYAVFPTTPGLTRLNYYITQASKQIAGRHESITPSKIVAELTLGFWVSLLNSESLPFSVICLSELLPVGSVRRGIVRLR